MNAPQVVWLILVVVSLTEALIKHGQPKTGRHSFTTTAIGVGLGAALLWWGGFFGGGA